MKAKSEEAEEVGVKVSDGGVAGPDVNLTDASTARRKKNMENAFILTCRLMDTSRIKKKKKKKKKKTMMKKELGEFMRLVA